jgi:hypothetical protein
MSARPDWLTDEMLAEMRRLKGSSKDKALDVHAEFWPLNKADYDANPGDDTAWWIDSDDCDDECWLTPAGHKALAAIEVEAAGELTIPEEYWLVCPDESETIRVSPSDGSHIIFTKPGRYRVVLPGRREIGSVVVVPDRLVGVPISDISTLRFEHTTSPKPCTNCDHGNGSSGVSIFGMRCYTCNGKKVT